MHHRLGVPLGMARIMSKGTSPGMRSPFSSTITAGTPILHAGIAVGGVQTYHGVAGGAGQPVGVELGAIYLRVFSKRGAQHADGIVATVAVARKRDAARLVADKKIDAGAIERRAEGVRVQRLTPLAVGFLVACAAVLRAGIRAGLKKSLALNL
jgi:hypothetical protein